MTVSFWAFSFNNSQDQTIDESQGSWCPSKAPTSLWDQDFADRHAAQNKTGKQITQPQQQD
jgi:hypothetical protein